MRFLFCKFSLNQLQTKLEDWPRLHPNRIEIQPIERSPSPPDECCLIVDPENPILNNPSQNGHFPKWASSSTPRDNRILTTRIQEQRAIQEPTRTRHLTIPPKPGILYCCHLVPCVQNCPRLSGPQQQEHMLQALFITLTWQKSR